VPPVRTDDGSLTLLSARYGETYRSRRGAVSEARHVFVEGAGVAARLARGEPTAVLEIGLGTCLNLVVTASLALEHGTPLCYHTLEHDPLPAATLARLELERAGDPAFVAALLDARAAWPASGWSDELRVGPVSVRVWVGEASAAALPSGVHAVYLDAFSPSVNPEPWAPAALASYAGALAPGGVLVSYSVSGAVRRALRALGLEAERRPGPPGGKREMLRARRPSCAAP
jgi:tRNA U34 5-methylaminomethyl-2-thiouridine-forming methyltransferase MnmC